jgi:MoxR-like ATPase
LLAIRAAADTDAPAEEVEARLFSERYLLRRPLLEAILQETPPVLLIDEIDRADEAFEAYLLEILADFQVTVPELGTIAAVSRPHVILTSNATRELSDALRRRCLYAYVEFPDRETELAILARRAPGLEPRLAAQIVGFVQKLRAEDLEKTPGVAETLDWVAALAGLGISDLTDDLGAVQSTLVCLLKTRADQAAIAPEVTARLVGRAA